MTVEKHRLVEICLMLTKLTLNDVTTKVTEFTRLFLLVCVAGLRTEHDRETVIL
jgi:hypothetical protein